MSARLMMILHKQFCGRWIALACLLAAGAAFTPAALRAQDEAPPALEEDIRYVLIATYPNTPEAWDREELVIRCLFRSHSIRWYSIGTAGATVGVRQQDEDRARRLLAEALLMERLDITLLKVSEDGGRAAVLTPEEVLSQPEKGEY